MFIYDNLLLVFLFPSLLQIYFSCEVQCLLHLFFYYLFTEHVQLSNGLPLKSNEPENVHLLKLVKYIAAYYRGKSS